MADDPVERAKQRIIDDYGDCTLAQLTAGIDALIAAVRAENAPCKCGDYRSEHQDGTGRCLTCAAHAHMQPFVPCEQFRPSAENAPTQPAGSFGYCPVCYHPLDGCSNCG